MFAIVHSREGALKAFIFLTISQFKEDTMCRQLLLIKKFNPTLRLSKRPQCRPMYREKKIQRKYDVFLTIYGLYTLQQKNS